MSAAIPSGQGSRGWPLPPGVEEALLAQLDGFALVYQGGHHDVYCDGSRHKVTDGGYTRVQSRSRITGESGCDCAQWSAPVNGVRHAL